MFTLIKGSLGDDAQAINLDELIDRMNALAKIIDLFNQSDWQPSEVAMWLQYEKDLALVESKLYQEKHK